MFCTNCGSKLPDDALFCPDCGEKVIFDQEDQNLTAEMPDEDINIPDIDKTVILNNEDRAGDTPAASEETVNINLNNHGDEIKKEDTQTVFNDIQESLAHSDMEFEQNTQDSVPFQQAVSPASIYENGNSYNDESDHWESQNDGLNKPKQKNTAVLIGSIIACAVVIIAVIVALIFMISSSGKKKKNYEDQVNQAEQYMSDSEYDEAIEAFREAIEIDGDSEDAYLGLADAYIKNQEYRKAAEVLQQGSKATGSQKRIEEKKEELYDIAPELKDEFENSNNNNSSGSSQVTPPETPAVESVNDSEAPAVQPDSSQDESRESQTSQPESVTKESDSQEQIPDTESWQPDESDSESSETSPGGEDESNGDDTGDIITVGTVQYQMKEYYHETLLPNGTVGAYTKMQYPYFLGESTAAASINAYMSNVIKNLGASEEEVKQYTGEENIEFPLYDQALYEVTYGDHGVVSLKYIYESASTTARTCGLIFSGLDGGQLSWTDILYGNEQDLADLIRQYYDPKANKNIPVEEFLKRLGSDWNNCYLSDEGIHFIAPGEENAQVLIPFSESGWFRFFNDADPTSPPDTSVPEQSETTPDSENVSETENTSKTVFEWIVEPVLEFDDIAVITDDMIGKDGFVYNEASLAVYMKDGALGFADYDGNILSEPKYNMVYSCSASGESSTLFASVMGSDIWSAKAIDVHNGSELHDSHMGHGGDESILVYSRSDGKRYYLYFDGFTEITETMEHCVPVAVVDNIAEAGYAAVAAGDGVKYGLCNEDGTLNENSLYDYIYMNSGGLMTALSQGKYGVINEAGNVVIPFEYDAAPYLDFNAVSENPEQIAFCEGAPYSYSEGYIALKKDGLWGYFDTDGNCVTDMVFEEARPLNQGRAYVKKDGKWGIISIIPQS